MVQYVVGVLPRSRSSLVLGVLGLVFVQASLREYRRVVLRLEERLDLLIRAHYYVLLLGKFALVDELVGKRERVPLDGRFVLLVRMGEGQLLVILERKILWHVLLGPLDLLWLLFQR